MPNEFKVRNGVIAPNILSHQGQSTQDGILVQAINSGSASHRATITNASLTANRTITIPDATGTIAFIGDVQTFTSNGTWTKPNNCTFVFVRIIGGGAGGNGGQSGGTPTLGSAGGGGAGCMEYLYLASALPSTVSVTIGAGGTGGTADGYGGDGTGSTFGIYLRSGRGIGTLTAGGASISTGGASGSMAVPSSGGASTVNQVCTMLFSTGVHPASAVAGSTTRLNRSSNSGRDSYTGGAAGGGGGHSVANPFGGYGGAGFWVTLSTSVDLVTPLTSSVRGVGTPIGNGAAPGVNGGGAVGDNGGTATRMGDGGGGGNYGTTTGGNGGAGFRGGGGGAGGCGGTTGGTGGAGGNGYCEVYSW